MLPENTQTKENNLRAWSALFHETLFAALAPEGFEEITDDRGKRKVAKLDYLTRDRIKRAATLIMNIWKKEKEELINTIENLEYAYQESKTTAEYFIKNESTKFLPSNSKITEAKEKLIDLKATLSILNDLKVIFTNSTPPTSYDSF